MNRSHRLFHAFLGLLALLLAMSCKPRVPREYISPGEMENILYDYHLADAVYSTRENYIDTLGMHVYKAAILKKYGRTEAEFDSSMVYYMRHSDRLQDIYERLSKRLSDNAVAHGTPEGSVARTTFTANGDTANVWNGELAMYSRQRRASIMFLSVSILTLLSTRVISLSFRSTRSSSIRTAIVMVWPSSL